MRRLGRALKTFYVKAYEDNLTGLSGMVAYNLLLSLFPLALLALFIASRILRSGELEDSVFSDLQRLFPSAAEGTITSALNKVKASSTGIGVVAVVTSIWFGSSFWGALDTAFCRIYHVECRSWLRQKRFALAMLVVVLAFMAATVLIPTAQSILVAGANGLPFGLKNVEGLVYAITLVFSLLILFGVVCVIYWAVPNQRMPWRGIWPGAALATIAVGIVDYSFPLYLTNVSTIGQQLGSTLVFIVIVLLWFYALAIILLGGGIVNALRLEPHDAGVHPSAKAFGDAAELYDRVRPGYPPAAIDWLTRVLDLGPERTVLDLAAGTGKLTVPLLATEARVVAVEPSEGMLAVLRRAALGAEALPGTAERIPLDDASVDAVVVGQAFHWFDHDVALPEIHRVLRPGGALALVWNRRDLDHPAHAALERAIAPWGSETPRHRDRPWVPALERTSLFEPLAEEELPNDQELPPGGLVERAASISYMAALPEETRREALAELERYEAGAAKPIVLPHVCELFAFRRAD
jgi:YihY family inner membrane protein